MAGEAPEDDGRRGALARAGVDPAVLAEIAAREAPPLPASPARGEVKSFRFTPADDAVLRAAYAMPIEQFDLQIVADTIGCTKAQARKRASHLDLGSRDRQRAKASAFATGQHARGEI